MNRMILIAVVLVAVPCAAMAQTVPHETSATPPPATDAVKPSSGIAPTSAAESVPATTLAPVAYPAASPSELEAFRASLRESALRDATLRDAARHRRRQTVAATVGATAAAVAFVALVVGVVLASSVQSSEPSGYSSGGNGGCDCHPSGFGWIGLPNP